MLWLKHSSQTIDPSFKGFSGLRPVLPVVDIFYANRWERAVCHPLSHGHQTRLLFLLCVKKFNSSSSENTCYIIAAHNLPPLMYSGSLMQEPHQLVVAMTDCCLKKTKRSVLLSRCLVSTKCMAVLRGAWAVND